MSNIFVLVVVFSVLVVHSEHAAGFMEPMEGGLQRVMRRAELTSSLDDYPVEDVDLLQPLFRTPLKRQWCRRGMAYNPALGTCTFSVAAMRGRGRKYRRH
uniref:Conopeptide n=1 Tax=Conus lenavati TaxID=1519839 RepID=A0A0K8TUR9_CONLV